MKVGAVSSYNPASKSKEIDNIDKQFLCALNEDYRPTFRFKDHKLEYIGGLAALAISIASLSKFIGKKSISKEVVELTDKTLGLNKITGADRTVAQLKSKILYPMKALSMGEKKVLHTDFKTGLIIGDTDANRAQSLTKAFLEHAEALGIHCERIQYPKKTNRLKEVHRTLDEALAYHARTSECVIVDIGDLGRITNLKVAKVKETSKIEERLAKVPKGVLWVSRTTESSNLPYFYNNLPVLTTKIVE